MSSVSAQQFPATSRPTPSPPGGPQSSCTARHNPFMHTQPNFTDHLGLAFLSTKSLILGINKEHSSHIPEKVNYVLIPPEHTLKSTSCSRNIDKMESDYMEEGLDRNFPHDCDHFTINPRLTENFWQTTKPFFALVDP